MSYVPCTPEPEMMIVLPAWRGPLGWQSVSLVAVPVFITAKS